MLEAARTLQQLSIEIGRQRSVGVLPLDRESQLAGNGQRHRQVFSGQLVRLPEVRHEFSDELAPGHQWNEGRRADSFPEDRSLERGFHRCAGDIGDRDGRRIHVTLLPRRVPGDRLAVPVGQAVPGDKLRGAAPIE